MTRNAPIGFPAAAILFALASALSGRVTAGAEQTTPDRYDFDAVMRGTGGADDQGLTYSFQIWCEPDERQNALLIQWRGGNAFVLQQVRDLICLDQRDSSSPVFDTANFDTQRGEGLGSYNGTAGARAQWTFTDGAGTTDEDRAEITITDPAGNIVLNLVRAVARHLASGRALLPVMPGIDPDGIVHSAEIDPLGRVTSYTLAPLPDDAVTEEPVDPTPKPDTVIEVPQPKIHPTLERRIAEGDPEEHAIVVITRVEDVGVPRLPDLPRGVTLDSREAGPIAAAQAAVIERLAAERGRSTGAFVERVARDLGMTDLRVLETSWLVNAFVADVRLGAIRALADLRDVLHIGPNVHEIVATPPTHDDTGFPHGTVADGRLRMRSDVYFNMSGMLGGEVGLLDTGVAPHTLLAVPFDVRFRGDCSDGGPFCLDFNLPGFDDTIDCFDHGTASAAIIAGNGTLGNAVRGVTPFHVDSWKVWVLPSAAIPHCSLNDGVAWQAVARGFQTGLNLFDRVFAVVIQPEDTDAGPFATAADNAFDAGAVVVAANGNCAVASTCDVAHGSPSAGTVRAPANAHKALGIGVYNVVDLSTGDYQGRGPTADGRIKPDIQAPTDVLAASNAGFNALQERFGGTSAATPFAASAAALMRRWLRHFNIFDPGYTNARMILSGNLIWSGFGYSNRFGVGRLQMPDPCGVTANWGKVTFSEMPAKGGTVFNVPITVASGNGNSLAVALWWPESAQQAHDDIDLFVLDPNGVERAKATSQPSIFERTEVAGPLVPGTWTLKIKGTDVNSPPQAVYWTADVRMTCVREQRSDRKQ